jgi:hypothetical protein
LPNFSIGSVIQRELVGSFADAFACADGLAWSSFNLRRPTYKSCGMTYTQCIIEKQKREGISDEN